MRVKAAVVTSLFLVTLVATPTVSQAHECDREEPYCADVRTLVQKREHQRVTSRQLGHYCAMHADEDNPQADRRKLLIRISVEFSEVKRDSGRLESITIHFEGKERQAGGRVNAWGKHGDVDRYDSRRFEPGEKLTVKVGKRVEFGDDHRSPDRLGTYVIRHETAAGPVTGTPGGPGPPGRDADPGMPRSQPPGSAVDCWEPHSLGLSVAPPSHPPCRDSTGACES